MSAPASIPELAASATALFRHRFKDEPDAVAAAPGRVNLIGEHVDYEGGLVMPMAINRWLAVALKATGQPVIRGASAIGGEDGARIEKMPADDRAGDGPWMKYVAGVLNGYRKLGWDAAGIDIAAASTLPAGAGLSSSAALETAAAVALEQCGAPTLDPVGRARLCQEAERDFAGVPCGIMDQLAAGCAKEGHALFIDCRSLEHSPVALPTGLSALVIDTGVRHELGRSEYPKRRAECRDAARVLGVELLRDASIEAIRTNLSGTGQEVLRNRATHVVNENSRVTAFAEALRTDNRAEIRSCMAASHDSLRELFEVSCAELDLLVSIARDLPGVVGCRMTGGGFGGSVVALVEETEARAVAAALVRGYRREGGPPACALEVMPAAGAAACNVALETDPERKSP